MLKNLGQTKALLLACLQSDFFLAHNYSSCEKSPPQYNHECSFSVEVRIILSLVLKRSHRQFPSTARLCIEICYYFLDPRMDMKAKLPDELLEE